MTFSANTIFSVSVIRDSTMRPAKKPHFAHSCNIRRQELDSGHITWVEVNQWQERY